MMDLEVKIHREGLLIILDNTGSSVSFNPRSIDKTFNAVIAKCLELDSSYSNDNQALEALRRSIDLQLTQIYREYEAAKATGTLEEAKPQISALKYSGNGILHESIRLGGIPFFLSYKDDKIILSEKIEESVRELVPIAENEPAPYSFENIQELQETIDSAKHETLHTLYLKTKSTVKKFNDIENRAATILAADIVFTYLQDKIGMTHYLFSYGLPGTGKGAMLETAHQLAYRAVLVTSATSASIYRTLGSLEPGQACILIDEANSLDENIDLQEVLKTGYKQNGQVPRVLDASSSVHTSPTWFRTFGWKMIAAERLPSEYKAAGLLTRCFRMKTYLGKPELKIDKVVAHGGNPQLEALYKQLMHLRKLLFAYRIIHFNESIPDVKLNIDGRDEELCSPLVRLFKDTDAKAEILNALTEFVVEKQSAKADGFEAYLYARVSEMIKEGNTNEFEFSTIWSVLKELLSGTDIEGKAQSMRTERFGDMGKRLVSQTLQKFGAQADKDNTGNKRVLVFDKERFAKFAAMFDVPANVEIESKVISDTLTLLTLYGDDTGDFVPAPEELENKNLHIVHTDNSKTTPVKDKDLQQESSRASPTLPEQVSELSETVGAIGETDILMSIYERKEDGRYRCPVCQWTSSDRKSIINNCMKRDLGLKGHRKQYEISKGARI